VPRDAGQRHLELSSTPARSGIGDSAMQDTRRSPEERPQIMGKANVYRLGGRKLPPPATFKKPLKPPLLLFDFPVQSEPAQSFR
jgi:hypothetical protein